MLSLRLLLSSIVIPITRNILILSSILHTIFETSFLAYIQKYKRRNKFPNLSRNLPLNMNIFLVIGIILFASCSNARSPARVPVIKGSTTKAAPRPPVTKKPAPLIVIDAGHGGMDQGASSRGILEKTAALKTAQLIQTHLRKKGYRVKMTRLKDEFIPLAKRAQVANASKARLFVSIHYNAAKSIEAKGIEVYFYNSKEPWRLNGSKKLATCVLHRLIARTGARSRGVKSGNFHVIRETNMPAILVEGGFITNKGEGSLIKDQRYLDRVALSVAEGIDRYFKT